MENDNEMDEVEKKLMVIFYDFFEYVGIETEEEIADAMMHFHSLDNDGKNEYVRYMIDTTYEPVFADKMEEFMEVWGEWVTDQFKETGEFQCLVPSHGFALN
jgi:hypothetical protein